MDEKVIFFSIFPVVVIVAIVVAAIVSKRRRDALVAVAGRVGLQFSPDAGDIYAKYESFTPFGRGRSRRSRNVLHGRRGEIDWEIFDYRFRTGSGKNSQTHHYGIAAATVPIAFRKLTIRPEGFFDRIAQMVGFDDINFESEAFSRRYHVSCDVRKFAYDIIHPRMIEFFLEAPAHHWQLAGNVILIHRRGSFDAEQVERLIEMVEGFVGRIPDYVRRDAEPLPRPHAV